MAFLCTIITRQVLRRLMKEKDIRILLVDDHDLVLQGLKRIIECSLPEVKNVCTASSGHEVELLTASQQFDLFVLDMELPDVCGLDLINTIRSRNAHARILVNTMHEEIWYVKNLLQCEVDGILFKSTDSGKITEAIRRVLAGGVYYCPYADHIRAQMKRTEEKKARRPDSAGTGCLETDLRREKYTGNSTRTVCVHQYGGYAPPASA